jgi:signal transduction histidine kinase
VGVIVLTGASLFGKSPRTSLASYRLACLVTVVALLVHWGLSVFLGDNVPYLTLFPAVAFSALYCGVRPSILSTVLALAGTKYWFIPVTHSLRVLSAAEFVGMGTFLVAASVVVAIGEVRRREHEILRRAQGELQERVKERTAELDGANQSLRELSARLMKLQDDERRRIARELHDSVGQTLAALTMNLSTVRADIDRLTKAASTLADSEALVQEMSKEVRTISYLLHPPLLDEAGLASALRWYIEGFVQRSAIKVELDFPEDFGRLPQESETAIFRMVQECLTNIHRHSESPIARVRLSRSDGSVRVEVADRGKGIAPSKQMDLASVSTPGVGIRGMRERFRQLNGDLEISSNHGKGTIVVAQLPVPIVSSSDAA